MMFGACLELSGSLSSRGMKANGGARMTRLCRVGVLLLPLLVLLLIPERPLSAVQDGRRVRFPADVPPRNDILLDNHVPVRMRDGVTLYADVYRPAGEGRHPVLAVDHALQHRTVSRPPTMPPSTSRARLRVRVPGRAGTPRVGGRLGSILQRREDGYDTIEWAAKQPWSDGKVAMQGGSYLGQNQWRAAQAAPPSLVTIFPMVASTSIYHDWITLNGGWRLSFNFGWGPVRQESRIMQNPGRTPSTAFARSTTTRCSGTCR